MATVGASDASCGELSNAASSDSTAIGSLDSGGWGGEVRDKPQALEGAATGQAFRMKKINAASFDGKHSSDLDISLFYKVMQVSSRKAAFS